MAEKMLDGFDHTQYKDEVEELGQGGLRQKRHLVAGLAEMYAADARFAANYAGEAGAGFVRDALRLTPKGTSSKYLSERRRSP